jgi:hypothetical protein
VQIVSTDSSDISKAVTEFIRADNEFQQKINLLASATPPAPATPTGDSASAKNAATEVADQVVRAAVVKPADQVLVEAKNIPLEQKAAVMDRLRAVRDSSKSQELKTKLNLLIESP